MKSLSEQRKIIDAATPGPWTSLKRIGTINAPSGLDLMDVALDADTAFVCASRTEWPELLVWAELARKYLDDMDDLYNHGLIGDASDDDSVAHHDVLKKLLSELPE